MPNYHPVVQKIHELIKSKKFWFETFEHEEVKTSEQAALTRPGYSLHQGAKAMIIKIKAKQNPSPSGRGWPSDGRVRVSGTNDNFVMLVFPADQKFDSNKVRQALDVKNLRFATEPEVSEITNGVQIGGVPPFGNLFNLDVYADPSLFQNEKIVFNAGDRSFSVAIKSEDYKILVAPKVTDII